MDDFLPMVDGRPGEAASVAWRPSGGRSSNGVLPFMNLQRAGGGMVLAVGWSGQWAATFERDGKDAPRTAGMEQTHLLPAPGREDPHAADPGAALGGRRPGGSATTCCAGC